MGNKMENHHAFSIGNMAIHLQIGGSSIASELHILFVAMVNISPASNIFIMFHIWAGCFVTMRMVLFHSPHGFCHMIRNMFEQLLSEPGFLPTKHLPQK